MNELAGYNVGPYENTEDSIIKDYKKEIKSLKCRLTNALKQRDDWAMKYANAMSKKIENNSCDTSEIVVDSPTSVQ